MTYPHSSIGNPDARFNAFNSHQPYHLHVPGTVSAALLSVVSFRAIEKLGALYCVNVQLTHPLALSRTDYLGKEASFAIAGSGLHDASRTFSGCITRFSQIRRTGDEYTYDIVIEPLVARLRLTRASRIYQQQTALQIIEAVLRRHGFDGNQFVFKTRRSYPQHAFRFQYQQSDWDYIHLLMRQEGLYSYFIPGKFGDTLVFADDIDHYLYQPELKVPYRESAGLEADTETVFTMHTHAETVPASFLVADYNPDQSYERFKDEANIARKDTTTYGQPYVFGTHHLDQAGAKWEAQLRHEAALAGQIVYVGQSNVLALCPARILRMDQTLPDAPNGQLITEVTHSGARDAAYQNSYKAIPSDRRFRLPLDEEHWPTINGTLSARVTSPGQYKYAYLTQQGHYAIRFDLDFDAWNPGGESVPLRLAKPFAGARETGFHFPAVDGTEAAIAFMDGNPNKPYIAHFHHNSRHPDHITADQRWLSRNVIRTQSNNKLRFEDWEGQEGIKLSTEFAGKTQLNLGYLVDSKKQKRGEGFELRTDGCGAIRGGKGLLISADAQGKANGEQRDMEAAKARLDVALAQMQALANAATTAQADAAEINKQNQLLTQRLDQLQQAVLLLSAPDGMALTSGHDLQLAAQGNAFVTAKNADIGVLKKFTVAVGEAISLFACKLGIKIFAAKGKIDMQAQSDDMLLTALKDIKITSVEGKLILAANKEVWIGAGGSYIKINACGIHNCTPGDILEKCAHWNKPGPSSMIPSFPQMPMNLGSESAAYSQQIDIGQLAVHHDPELIGSQYEIWSKNKQPRLLAKGVISDMQTSVRIFTQNPEDLDIILGDNEWSSYRHLDQTSSEGDPA
jgi:type VI secretion system secreted protein VgrG